MRKYIIRENGIGYTLGEDGFYYPDLRLPDETEYDIGKFGRLLEKHLKEHQRWVYLDLLTSGKLSGYLLEIDVQCSERLELMVEADEVVAGDYRGTKGEEYDGMGWEDE